MLQTIRDKAHGVLAWLILVSIAVPFALWGIQNYTDGGKERPVATVGDREFFERDVNRVSDRDLSGLSDLDDEQVRQAALERLIRDALMSEAVVKLKLGVGDEELRTLVQSLPPFQTDGRFDKEKYKLALTAQGMSPQGFAEQMRTSVLMDQFQQGVTHTGFATTRSLEQYYRLKDQQRAVEYAVIPVVTDGAPVSEEAIQEYYLRHTAEFQTPEQVAVDYVSLKLEDVARRVVVSDETLRAFYEEQKANFTSEEKRRISHILVSVAPNAGEDAFRQALEKAGKIRDRLAKEDFAAVAKEVSEDSETAAKGGDLGILAAGQMEKNFEEAARSLQKAGDISQPVKTPFGYHLIKLAELQPGQVKTFGEVKPELTANYQRTQAEKEFYELGQRLSEVSFENPDQLDSAAAAIGAKVEKAAAFSRARGEGLAALAPFREAAFNPEVLEGRNSEPLELAPDHVVVLRVRERIPAAQKPLDEVRVNIAATLRVDAGRIAAKEKAKAALESVNQGKPLDELAKQQGWTVRKAANLRRENTDVPREIIQAIFRAPRPEAGKTAWRLIPLNSQEQAIVGLTGVTDGDIKSVDTQELEKTRDFLSRVQGQGQFTSLLEQLWQDGDVNILEKKDKN
ncbi:MAG TPA: SurA N-terminal domain-containing protein [Methylococcaceae bacterium]|nr:SurA N-terminal domain-containing protein [Methylococcaceae bacterium]